MQEQGWVVEVGTLHILPLSPGLMSASTQRAPGFPRTWLSKTPCQCGLHTAKTRVPVWHQGALYCPGLSCGTHVLRTHTFGTLHPDTASLKKRSDGRKKHNSVCNFGVYDCGPLDVSISIIEFMIRCENLNKMFPAL